MPSPQPDREAVDVSEGVAAREFAGSTDPDGARMHLLGRFLVGRSRAAVAAKLLLLALGVVLGLRNIAWVAAALTTDEVYHKDFLAVYVLIRAVTSGADPLTPIDDLAYRYIGSLPFADFPHPTPHPPTLGLLLAPLAALDYRSAAATWLVIEIACLAVAIAFVLRIASAPRSPLLLGAVVLALLVWEPIGADLYLGQVTIPIMLLTAAMVRALQTHRRWLAGALLGGALLLKPVTWPLLVAVLLRRDWRTAAATVVTGLLGLVIAGWCIGLDRLLHYGWTALPAVSRQYQGGLGNISIWAFGHHLFRGFRATFGTAGTTVPVIGPPLIPAAGWETVVAPGGALVLLAIAVWATRRLSYEFGLALMLCLSIVVNPLAWSHSLVLAILPAALVVRQLWMAGFPVRETNWAVIIALLPTSPLTLGTLAIVLSQAVRPSGDGPIIFPTGLSLLVFVPLMTVLVLAALVMTLGRAQERPIRASPLGSSPVRGWQSF